MNKAYIENTIKFYNECIKAGLDITELYDNDDCLGIPYPDAIGLATALEQKGIVHPDYDYKSEHDNDINATVWEVTCKISSFKESE